MTDVPAAPVSTRLRAWLDMDPAGAREGLGRHEYDGVVADLSPAAVAERLARLGTGPVPSDALDAALLAAAEEGARVVYGELAMPRWNPLLLLNGLDLACYDREYAPPAQRAQARATQLSAWPAAVDAALASLDAVPAPVATALLPAVLGLSAGVSDPVPLAALGRLVTLVEDAAERGAPSAALGADGLARVLGAAQAKPVSLDALASAAAAERDRLRALLDDACEQLRPGVGVADVVAELLDDHPSTAEEIYAEARTQVHEVTAFTVERELLPPLDGECLVGPAPASRSWAMAMMSWAAPYESDAPSWYHVTPPDPSWPARQQQEWLAVFSRTTLPAITVHEVTPGHFAHGRLLRRAGSHERRCCLSEAFVEGWAHYVEELFVEEGFRAGDPRFAIGVMIEALVRVTRLAVSIGVHADGMSVEDGARRFVEDAFLRGEAARSEAQRATFDPTYGRYTWGKLEIRAARERARQRWGPGYSHRRFHEALLAAGAPPLGLLDTCVAAAG
ncbi:MAG TPA: DUF885 family protein [Mycobacteriales bacterium]|nr:DUF885 family protein [Mycobacteriales bacterium]